jgi:hypothetical protein
MERQRNGSFVSMTKQSKQETMVVVEIAFTLGAVVANGAEAG